MCLSGKMRQRMNALAYKVKPVRVPVAVESFKFKNPLTEKLVRCCQLFLRDALLMDDSDGPDELAEVGIVGIWENVVKYSGAFTVDVVEKFPSFVTA